MSVKYGVALRGQFDKGRVKKHRLTTIDHFSNPVDKKDEGIFDKDAYLTWYTLAPQDPPEPTRKLR